jgi:hypothetical protein
MIALLFGVVAVVLWVGREEFSELLASALSHFSK